MIPFTQFIRPNGRKIQVTIDCSEQVEAMAAALLGAGYRFEVEVLTTGQVSMEVLKSSENVLGAIICANNESVLAAVELMVKSSYETFKSATVS